MGAEFFDTESLGKTAEEAFHKAVKQAQYDFGHSGYTGTIAEKISFTLIEVPENISPYDYMNELIENSDSRLDDKWGPALCIELEGTTQSGQKRFLFFGYASS